MEREEKKQLEEMTLQMNSHFWTKRPKDVRCDFATWRKRFILDSKVNIIQTVFEGAVDGTYIKMSMGTFFNVIERLEDGGRCTISTSVRRLVMKAVYTGKDPAKVCNEFINFMIANDWENFIATMKEMCR